jgi:hypothetical protein
MSASLRGEIIVERAYEPVRKSSTTVRPLATVRRMVCWRVETTDD